MEIYTSDRYDDGMCLISTDSFTGLVNIQFLSKDASIKEYEKWYNEAFDNVLPISDSNMPLQWIYKSSVIRITPINDLAKQALDKSELTEEDVLVPFLGGVQGFDFKEMLIKLWEVEEKDHYKYISAINEYYGTLFKEIESSKLNKDD